MRDSSLPHLMLWRLALLTLSRFDIIQQVQLKVWSSNFIEP